MKGPGSGKTPDHVVKVLKNLVDKNSLSGVAVAVGISHSMLHRYLKGVGEPTIQSLQKIANYTGETFKIIVKPAWK